MSDAIDPKEFRRTVGQFATGVSVITVEVSGEVHGMTANALTSLSLDPMLMLFCVGKKSRMAGHLEGARGFTINILREEQQALSAFFAGMWKEEVPPPFRFEAWEGGPRLQGCAAAIGCRAAHRLEGGDHWIVVGEVIALHQGTEPRRPLLFYEGEYRHLDPGTGEPSPEALEGASADVRVFYDPWQDE